MEKLKSKFKYYFDRILTLVRVRSIVGGLEISNSTVRLVYFDSHVWHLGGVRLEPGVIEDGKIKDRARFIEALKSVKSQVFGEHYEKRRVSVVTSLSSASIYSQVFSLPIIKGKNLDKAIQLNIQMISPMDVAQTYSGWQVVGEDSGSLRLEILSAFIDRSLVDELSKVLSEAGFLLVVLESRTLSLTRLLREEAAGVDIDKPYIVISLDDSGLDFLITRHGQPYFEYFNPWREIVDEKGEISTERFRAAVTRSLYQVFNFYGQHWPETVTEVVVSATALKDEIRKIVNENFPLTVKDLKLKIGETIGPEWYIALGCGVRGSKPRGKDKEMSLLGIGAEEEFNRERFVTFASLWRLLIPVALGLVALSFFLSDIFLIQAKKSAESQSAFDLNSVQAKESQSLQAGAGDFNRLVTLIHTVQSSAFVKSTIIEKINNILKDNGVALVRLYFVSADASVSLNGEAKSESQLAALKKALEADSLFTGVNLPLSGVSSGQAGISFSMTFKINRSSISTAHP